MMPAKAMINALQKIQTYTKFSFFWLCSRLGTQPHFSGSFLISFLSTQRVIYALKLFQMGPKSVTLKKKSPFSTKGKDLTSLSALNASVC